MEKIQNLFSGIHYRQLLPYVVAILIFMVLTLVYVSPVLEGKRLRQPDIVNFEGMAKEIRDFRDDTGEEPLWTNSMFGGMPAFQISVVYSNNIANFLHDVMTLWLPRPADMIFLYFVGFFIFLLMLKINPWIALAGAVGFAFSSYHFIIVEVGHNSKAVAIAYMAPVLGSIIHAFRGNYLSGGILFSIFMGLQLFANHYQMTYYLAIIVFIYGIFILAKHLEDKRLKQFMKAFGALIAGLIIAIGINFGNFWSTSAYASETMRGGSELTLGEAEHTSGLSKEYITNWSYGISETFTLLIPNAKGGATGAIGENEQALENVDPGFRSIIANENQYWGDQPFTSGPVYVGVVVLFFFFMALFYVKGPLKWGLLIAIILSILLSWGKNFMPLTSFFIDYVPGYDKFRAVSMTLVIAELCIPALAFLGLNHLYKNPEKISIKNKAFLTAIGLTGGLSLLFYLFPDTFFSFTSQREAEAYAGMAAGEPQMAGQINQFLQNLENARMAIFRADAIRSFFFAVAAGAVLLLFAGKKIKPALFIGLVVALIVLDMWPINRRYLNNDHFLQRRRAEVPFNATQADNYIMQDPDHPLFRVLDLTESTFNSSRASYFHHSIGGYHGAKLQRYQEIIDFYLSPGIDKIVATFQESTSLQQITDKLAELPVFNMLNTRYIIYHPDADAIRNPHAMGNVWLVSDYRVVENADEEILALEDFDPTQTAIIDQRFASHLEGKSFNVTEGSEIELIHYQPNKLRYRYQSNEEVLAVFSEIYYPDGWEITINGEPASHFRANYILRAMVLPPGENEIVFEFKPRTYYAGQNIALTFSILMVLTVGGYFFWRVKNINRQDTKEENTEKP